MAVTTLSQLQSATGLNGTELLILSQYNATLGLWSSLSVTTAQLQAYINTNGQPGSLAHIIGQSHLPFVLCSSGTMGNNGALSGLTTLPNAYPAAYVYLPSGAIVSGSAAGWYYAVFSSTTAATVYNNGYTLGTPQIPASPTPFVTTGPGAFTQTTGSYIAAYALAIPGNTLGVNGAISLIGGLTMASSTNSKAFEGSYGSYNFGSNGIAASGTVSGGIIGGFANRGVTNVQVPLTTIAMGTSAASGTPAYGSVDSTQSQNLTINLKIANANDFIVLESIIANLIPGVT